MKSRALLKMEHFNLGKGFKQVAQEVLDVRHFGNGKRGSTKFLLKFNEITK